MQVCGCYCKMFRGLTFLAHTVELYTVYFKILIRIEVTVPVVMCDRSLLKISIHYINIYENFLTWHTIKLIWII